LACPLAVAVEDAGLRVGYLDFAPGSTEQLVWNEVPRADFYGLYRGRLGTGGLFVPYNHLCRATELADASAKDPDVPMPGTGFYYLATGLRKGSTPEQMDWGPVGSPSLPRPEGDLPCGRRIFLDPEATGGGTGLSWTDAHTTLADADAHPSPSDRSLEIWMTGSVHESLTVSRGHMVFYGGFLGTEKYPWERAPHGQPFLWTAASDQDLFALPNWWLCEEVTYVFDGIDFRGGRHAVFSLVSGGLFAIERSLFREQSGDAAQFDPPTDYLCGTDVFLDDSRFVAGGTEPLLNVRIEGGEVFDVRVHRSRFEGSGGRLVTVATRDGIFETKGRFEMLGCHLEGGDPAIDIVSESWEREKCWVEIALASNLVARPAGDAISIDVRAGKGDCRVEGEISHNTITDATGSGVVCTLSTDGGTGICTPELRSNLITFAGKYGVAEPDDSAAGLSGDFPMIGNDLYGNGTMYLDEGTTPLSSISEVNALLGNTGNLSEDPLYADRPGGDFHLSPASPVIDACMKPASDWIVIDMDAEARTGAGGGTGAVRPDIGADEH
jgi:hypothetical protein